ncbi:MULTISPECIES: CsbD family protein [unclassified Caballeronia]|uniref:CsbD family protein n=1 Tax=unclassified Caballeronia TaxID=2646786 RepID=UPI001F18DC12|nr:MULTISPECIES: CsbD family protein [unclassified Caballeronia]MCE4547620.1 CsbD family protein [Caballeronia sp. PC1]MCE4575078.1 CsbD family protein [Caballeronia sp. CLC5]
MPQAIRRATTNEDQVKVVGEKVKGKIIEGVGKVTNDPAQEAKGDAQQVEGEARRSWATPRRI